MRIVAVGFVPIGRMAMAVAITSFGASTAVVVPAAALTAAVAVAPVAVAVVGSSFVST